MPFYYFQLNNEPASTSFHADNLAAAKCEATEMAGKIICEEAPTFWDKAEWLLTVTDADGLIQFQLQFIGTDAPVNGRRAISPNEEMVEIGEAQHALRESRQQSSEQESREQRRLHRRKAELGAVPE